MVSKIRCFECGKELKTLDDVRMITVSSAQVYRNICTNCLRTKYPDVYERQMEAERRWTEETAKRRREKNAKGK